MTRIQQLANLAKDNINAWKETVREADKLKDQVDIMINAEIERIQLEEENEPSEYDELLWRYGI